MRNKLYAPPSLQNYQTRGPIYKVQRCNKKHMANKGVICGMLETEVKGKVWGLLIFAHITFPGNLQTIDECRYTAVTRYNGPTIIRRPDIKVNIIQSLLALFHPFLFAYI